MNSVGWTSGVKSCAVNGKERAQKSIHTDEFAQCTVHELECTVCSSVNVFIIRL